jgi:hypothetical protein
LAAYAAKLCEAFLTSCENPRCFGQRGFPAKGIERREVEKRIYGEERERLTASATFLLLEYLGDLNGK